MNILILCFHLILIGTLSFFFWKKIKEALFWPALSIKLLAGLALGLLYHHYYTTGDTWTLFNDGAIVADSISRDPGIFVRFFWYDDLSVIGQVLENNRPRALFLVKWIALFNFLNGNNYWITSLYFSFISFITCWSFYRTLANHLEKPTQTADPQRFPK